MGFLYGLFNYSQSIVSEMRMKPQIDLEAKASLSIRLKQPREEFICKTNGIYRHHQTH